MSFCNFGSQADAGALFANGSPVRTADIEVDLDWSLVWCLSTKAVRQPEIQPKPLLSASTRLLLREIDIARHELVAGGVDAV